LRRAALKRALFTAAQAVWTRFLDGAGAGEPHLCLLHAGLLSLFSPSGAPHAGARLARTRLTASCAGDAHAVPIAADVRSLHPSPFGLLLQRGAGSVDALLHPLEEPTAVALPPGAALLWSDDHLPLVRPCCGRGRLARAVLTSATQVAAHAEASSTLLLLRLQLAPPSGAVPPGAEAKRLQMHALWSATLVRPRVAHTRLLCA
jgi:hypothetical protein